MQLLEEMRETVPKEFDFLREARLMQVIAARARAAGLKGVTIPQPLLALSSKELLVMQRMPGSPCIHPRHPCHDSTHTPGNACLQGYRASYTGYILQCLLSPSSRIRVCDMWSICWT